MLSGVLNTLFDVSGYLLLGMDVLQQSEEFLKGFRDPKTWKAA